MLPDNETSDKFPPPPHHPHIFRSLLTATVCYTTYIKIVLSFHPCLLYYCLVSGLSFVILSFRLLNISLLININIPLPLGTVRVMFFADDVGEDVEAEQCLTWSGSRRPFFFSPWVELINEGGVGSGVQYFFIRLHLHGDYDHLCPFSQAR